jgi:predicted transcriptional regulator
MGGDDVPGRLVKRAALLALLREGPRTTAELEAALDLSRSTIHRTTTAFREEGLVSKTDDRFALTGFGRVAAAEVERFRDRVATADRLAPFLTTADVDGPDRPPLEAFADAEVLAADARRAHAPVKRIADRIAATDSLRMFSSVVSPVYLDHLSRAVADGTHAEAVFDARAVEVLFSEYRDGIREAVRTGRFEVFVYDACPFELFVYDGVVGLAAHDEGVLRAYVESDDPDAVAWAEARYEAVREGASHATVF